jgi:hypothetical protein
MSFSLPFNGGGFPFYTGTLAEAFVMPHAVTLDGVTYAVDLAEYRHASVDTLRENVVQTQEANDALFNAAGLWSRYRLSWHQGAGQKLSDLQEAVNRFRFEDSTRVYPWVKNELTLQHSTVNARSLTSSIPVAVRSGAYVFVSDGNTLYRTTDLVTWTAMTTTGLGTIQALGSDGQDLYIATSTQLVKLTGTNTTTTQFSSHVTGNCTNVAFVGNRLVVGIDDVLSEVKANGNLTTISDHWQSAFRWTTVFELGSRIYIGGFAGTRSELFTVTTDSSGNLVPGQEAAPFAEGEILRTAVSTGGVVALCTNLGVRFATIGQDGTLTYGPMITAPGDVLCAVSDSNYLWTGWTNYASGRAGTCQFDLGQFIEPLVPAYTAALSAPVTGNVTGVVHLGGKAAFCVAASGVYVEQTGYETSGTLDGGTFYFGTIETKRLSELQATFAPLTTGQGITFTVRDENNAVIKTFGTGSPGVRSLTIDLDGADCASAHVSVTLTGPGTTTPKLYHWVLRGYPVPPVSQQWVLPLLMYSRVTVGDGMGQELVQNTSAALSTITELWREKRRVLLQIGDYVARVRVDAFEMRPSNWRDDGGWFESIVVVRLITT